ncbi:hypothetical protein Rhopal_001389-T1 [Rhodotorula paludigena]|uniref:Uncharacterized protein n=1 Tax=Rhodotorula paludigena TaxID=86838 RepID=A0AAV5GE70_9BASI|nr:hypothetical protein Rhopal_001389-T1 [Rhodotorula paludigena]
MAQTLEERAAADDFVATLLRLEEELARTPATLESGTSISSDRESTKAAEAEQDAIRFEQERKLAELNDESSAYEAIISELRAEAQSRFAQVSQLSEAVSALTVTSARPPAPALPDTTPPAFTLCLINGYGLLLASLPESTTDKLVSSATLHPSPTQQTPCPMSIATVKSILCTAGCSSSSSTTRTSRSLALCSGVLLPADDNVEDAMSALLTAFSENDLLKLVYLIGVRLDQLYSVVNASERDDDDELLQTSGWRVTKFNRFFSTSDLSFAEPDKPRSPSTSLSAAVSAASSPIALAKKYIPGDRPVAASDGEDLTALYASLTTKTSKHKFDPAKRLLQQDPQMSVLQYFGVIGQDTHAFAVQLRLALLFKHRLHDGSWLRPQSQREKGSRCLFSQ